MQNNKSLQSIQFLRAFACLYVVFFHSTELYPKNIDTQFFWGLFQYGFSGVDIFFVLSGFIITLTSYKFIGKKAHTIQFLYKRIVRIFPTYWIIIVFFLSLQIIFPTFYRTHFSLNFDTLINTFLLLPGHKMINGVSWTLTHELWFYLIFALVFLLRKSIIILLYLAYFIAILIYLFLPKNSDYSFMIFHPMNIEFLLGIIAAIVFKKIPYRFTKTLITIGFLLLFLGAFIYSKQLLPSDLLRLILFGIPSFIIVVALAALEFHKPVVLNNIYISLGDASYSLYLLHLPILAATSKVISRFNFENGFIIHAIFLFSIAFLSLLSIIFYKYVERPTVLKLGSLYKRN